MSIWVIVLLVIGVLLLAVALVLMTVISATEWLE
jgi:hypothetical protein